LQWTSYCVITGNNISNNFGLGGGYGIFLVTSYYSTVINNTLWSNAYINIQNYDSDFSVIQGNRIIANPLNGFGISVRESNNCYVQNNSISNPLWGIYVQNLCTGISIIYNQIDNCRGSSASGPAGIKISSISTVRNNTISFSDCGLYIFSSASNSVVYHNAFLHNGLQTYDEGSVVRDNGYPSGGNFWSDYTGIDWYSGPNQDQPGADGIGDIPYIIDSNTRDRYPLMAPLSPLPLPVFTINLSVGWNLISIPQVMADTSIESVLSSIAGTWDVAKWYDPLDSMDHWKSFRPGGVFNDLGAIDNTMGFWLHATANCTLTVEGAIPASTNIPLHAGWNLVGYPSQTEMSVANALWGTGADRVEVCDLGAPGLITPVGSTYLMRPGEGYWVHVAADCVWTVGW
jgi:parallel beta-helix repeat protein